MNRLWRVLALFLPLGASAVMMGAPVGAQDDVVRMSPPIPRFPGTSSPVPYVPPRTPWGHPDLQGTYSNDDETGTPMARPAQFAGPGHGGTLAAILESGRRAFVSGDPPDPR